MSARTQLSMLTAVRDGRERDLRALLANIPIRDDSPFAKVPGTHNGRFTVVRAVADGSVPLRAGGIDEPLLMCSATIDPEPREWLATFLDVLGPLADDIWSNCPNWPTGRADQLDHLLAHRIPSLLDFGTIDDVGVDEIRRALERHERLADLALASRRLTPDELLTAYREIPE